MKHALGTSGFAASVLQLRGDSDEKFDKCAAGVRDCDGGNVRRGYWTETGGCYARERAFR
jgi:hypothetical protein